MEKHKFVYLAKDWANAHFWLNDEDAGLTELLEQELIEANKPYRNSSTRIWPEGKCSDPVVITAICEDDPSYRLTFVRREEEEI